MNKNEYTIILNNRCNRKCSYCHQEHSHEEIRNEDILNFLYKMNSKTNENINLTIFGGEPLLSKDKIELISKTEFSDKINLLMYTNLDYFKEDDYTFLKKFKEVIIRTEFNIMTDKLFFRTKKYQTIESIKNVGNVIIQVHSLISKENVDKILFYVPFILKYRKYLCGINLLFDIVFPSENDFNEKEFLNIINFVHLIPENLLSSNLYKLKYFLEKDRIRNSFCSNNCNIRSNSELTLKYDGTIIPCRRFSNYNYSEMEIDEIEFSHKECEKCLFNFYCDECKYSYYGISNKGLKCNRIKNIIKAYEFFLLNKYHIPKFYNFSIILGIKCNSSCYFCQRNLNIKDLDLFKLKTFLKNNYYRLNLDTVIGGEPLLYLNEKYEFFNDYFDEINIISNLSFRNEYVHNNPNLKITVSIQNKNFKNLEWDYYRNNIIEVLILLNNEVIEIIDDIMSFLMERKIKFRFIDLFCYKTIDFISLSDENKTKLKEIKTKYSVFVNKKNKNYYECVLTKLNIVDDKLTLCYSLYEPLSLVNLEKNVVISEEINEYIINDLEVENKVNNLYKLLNFNSKKCISSYFLKEEI